MFLLANSRRAGFGDGDTPFHGSYAGLFEGDQQSLAGVVAHYRHGYLILQAPHDVEEIGKLALADSKRPVKGVIGESDQVGAVLDSMHLAAAHIQSDSVEYLYRISLKDMHIPSLPSEAEYTSRLADEADVPLIVEWMVRFRNETLEDPDTPEQRENCRDRVRFQVEEGSLWVLEHRGELVSMCAYNAKIAEAVQIGGVFTPVPHRSKRYARYLVAQSLLAARSEGIATGLLFTAMNNIAAQKAYVSLGFQQIGDYRICTFDQPVTGS